MHKPVLLAVVGLMALAQVLPSCGEGQAVIGWVDAKFPSPANNAYVIVINHVEYFVPFEFYQTVKVGDLVKFDNGDWTIVRRRT